MPTPRARTPPSWARKHQRALAQLDEAIEEQLAFGRRPRTESEDDDDILDDILEERQRWL